MELKFELICSGDPITLGIENETGDWNLKAFRAHLSDCEACRNYAGALQSTLRAALHSGWGGARPNQGPKNLPPGEKRTIRKTLIFKPSEWDSVLAIAKSSKISPATLCYKIVMDTINNLEK